MFYNNIQAKSSVSSKMAKEEGKIPLFSSKVTTSEQNLSIDEKVKIIDKEIRQLYEFCKKAGYTQAQIEDCAQPLLAIETRQRHIRCLRILAYFVVLVAFIGFLFAYDPTYRKICIYGKQAALKMLPYWDWTYIYEQDCLIENPYYENPNAMTKEDCKVCKRLKKVEVLGNVSQEEIAQDFLFQDIPVIVNDAIDSWIAKEKFNVAGILKVYEESQVARDGNLCDFQCTVPGYDHPNKFLKAVQGDEVKPGWQIFWQNCEKDLGKVFRQLYKRPYFLPLMAEAAESNWLFIADGGSKVLNKEWDGRASWIAQVHGHARIKLTPNSVCRSICRKLTVTLRPGEILTVTNDMWEMTYKPLGEGLVAALGSSVTWD